MCWVLKECEGKPKINYVTVFERPGLHEFLKKISEFADLILFTAGLEGLLITQPYINFGFCYLLYNREKKKLLSPLHFLKNAVGFCRLC